MPNRAMRVIIDVRYVPRADGFPFPWIVQNARQPAQAWPKRDLAIERAAELGRRILSQGGLAQVRVFTKRGTLSFERTYGRDPRRRKG